MKSLLLQCSLLVTFSSAFPIDRKMDTDENARLVQVCVSIYVNKGYR